MYKMEIIRNLLVGIKIIIFLLSYRLLITILDCYYLYKLNKINKKCDNIFTLIPVLNYIGKSIHSNCNYEFGLVLVIVQFLRIISTKFILNKVLGLITVVSIVYLKIKFYKSYNLDIIYLMLSLILGDWIMYRKVIKANIY